MTLVCNASPIIVLARAELLEAILRLATRVVIPMSVADEITRFNDPSDAACIWLGKPVASSFLWADPTTSDFVAAWGLGAGESSVISLVQASPDSIAVLDDLAARRCAGALRLKVVGTLGLLLIAKNAGLISTIRGPLNSIVAAGLFISPKHLAAIQRQAGE
jgi:predicted nucleic acid-binding protein